MTKINRRNLLYGCLTFPLPFTFNHPTKPPIQPSIDIFDIEERWIHIIVNSVKNINIDFNKVSVFFNKFDNKIRWVITWSKTRVDDNKTISVRFNTFVLRYMPHIEGLDYKRIERRIYDELLLRIR